MLFMLLFCSFTLAINIEYGDGNCDLSINEKDIGIMVELISGKNPICCLNETMNCVNMDMNKNNTFESDDLILLTETIYGNRTIETFIDMNMSEFLNFYTNFTQVNITTYIQNYTNGTEEYCTDNYNLTRIENITCPICNTCPACPPPVTNTIEKTVEVEKDVIWNWKVFMIVFVGLIGGLAGGYWYGREYGE